VEKEWLDTLATINPCEVTYTDFVSAGSMLAKELKEKGCHAVIALTHMRTPNDIRLAEEVEDIDLILGGHDHVYEKKMVRMKFFFFLALGGKKQIPFACVSLCVSVCVCFPSPFLRSLFPKAKSPLFSLCLLFGAGAEMDENFSIPHLLQMDDGGRRRQAAFSIPKLRKLMSKKWLFRRKPRVSSPRLKHS